MEITVGTTASRVPTNCSGGGENFFDYTCVQSRLNPRLSFWEQEGSRNALKVTWQKRRRLQEIPGKKSRLW